MPNPPHVCFSHFLPPQQVFNGDICEQCCFKFCKTSVSLVIDTGSKVQTFALKLHKFFTIANAYATYVAIYLKNAYDH